MSSTPDKPSIPKSRKIRGISAPETASETVNNENDDEDDDGLVASDEDSPLEASTLGLYHIRTRSAPSPLKLPNSIGTGSSSGDCSDDNRCKDEIEPKVSTEQGHPLSSDSSIFEYLRNSSYGGFSICI